MKTVVGGIILLVCIFFVWKAMDRDSRLMKTYVQDLRNRVVGARLQKDGKDPYFYTWKKEDGVRYYDPNNFDPLLISNITASPFFHRLLYPLVEEPQSTIRQVWVIFQYAMLFIMAFLCLYLTTDIAKRLLIICFTTAFLFTEAWRHTVSAGQLYLLIPFLYFLFFFFFRKFKQLPYAFACGAVFIVLVLIRPNTIIAFVPFLFLANLFGARSKLSFLLPVFFTALLLFSSSHERHLWSSYKKSIDAHIGIHDNEQKQIFRNIDTTTMLSYWEGMDTQEMKMLQDNYSYLIFTEAGNVSSVFRILFKVKLHPQTLMIMCGFVIIAYGILFFYRFRKVRPSLINLVIFGYCLYMISDMFSPIYRHQYYVVQWVAPLFLSLLFYQKKYMPLHLFMLAGLLLNIFNIPDFYVEHTIGEYIWLASFVLLSFLVPEKANKENTLIPA